MGTSRAETPPAGKVVDRLVVVGASAGGIEALSVVVAGLPSTFAAPIVVAQHLHPEHPSSLGEIIGRRTELRVETIEDRVPLVAGTVYVVPPDRHVSILDHEIRLDADDPERPKPSVDRLLETASEVFGDRLIAVILSGTGADGAAGAQYVAASGGTVIAQDPETAAFPSMPRSLLPQTVDAVTRVEAIGPLLESLVAGTTNLKNDGDGLDRFLTQLRERSGMDFTAYKRPTIVRRLERRMAATHSAGLPEYRRYLLSHPDEVHRLRSSLLIKVTDFFRDPDLFEHLRSILLPALIAGARDSRELRLWSAGCATGEEAYSLAILVAEILGPELGQWNIRIFATDADPQAITFARRGVYPASALRGVDARSLDRHFRRVDSEYEVGGHIRAMTVFGEHDLAQRAPFPRIDLVLCRNVLIYFTPELQRRALQLFAFSLRDGGFLVLGKSETTNPQPTSFVVEEAGLHVFRRSGDRTIAPTSRYQSVPQPDLAARPRGRRIGVVAGGSQAMEGPRTAPSERAETILLRLPIGVCVVDGTYDIVFLNTTARTLLGIHGAAVGEDFVHQARSLDSGPLRQALDRALGGEPAELRISVSSETPVGTPRILHLAFSPTSFEAPSGDANVLVTVVDVTGDETSRAEREIDAERRDAELLRLRGQVERLGETNRDLLTGNDELAVSNAELRTANEELVVYNEELQAATEEVETLNEELQATNEELETLNEELQATVEELNTANEDLAARAAAEQAIAPPPLRVVPPSTG